MIAEGGHRAMIKRDFLEKLAPVEVEMIRDYVLHEICPGVEGTANAENLNRSVKRCARCGSKKIIKYCFFKVNRNDVFSKYHPSHGWLGG